MLDLDEQRWKAIEMKSKILINKIDHEIKEMKTYLLMNKLYEFKAPEVLSAGHWESCTCIYGYFTFEIIYKINIDLHPKF
jgi:hypothetical protein